MAKKLDTKALTVEELVEKREELIAKMQGSKFNHAVSPLENSNTIKEMRRNIARVLTELRRRELEENN